MEIESTLVIVSRNPEQVADAIARLREIGGFMLRHREHLLLTDSYLDLPGSVLGNARLGLRLRRVSGAAGAGAQWLLTLKGPTRELDGARAREEIEHPWSAEALATVVGHIQRSGVSMTWDGDPTNREPADVLAEIGLRTTQLRDVYRRPRDVLRGSSSPTLAELVIDSVCYRLPTREIRHHEVEVEVKAPDGDGAMRQVTRALVDEFGPAVKLWRSGKFVTGRAVEQLLRLGRLDHLIDTNGCLEPEAYQVIEDWLSAA